MEIKEMSIEELTERRSAIAAELDAPEADLDALEAEVRSINEEIETRKQEEAKREELRAAVAAGAGEVIKEVKEERVEKMTNEEVRNSQAYIDAYANYIKTGSDKECRSLLTENVSGDVPVPVLVDQIVRTAWENEDILSRVRKTYFRGNLKVPFELSADGAYAHTEGTTAVTEESLTLGIVTMIPKNIKKWIRISDEAVAMGGETFLRYIYDELTYQIVKKLAGEVVGDIAGLSDTAGDTYVCAQKVTEAPGLTTFDHAFAKLSDEARNPVIIMNKLTYANFKDAHAAGNFAVDPFISLPVLFSSKLPAYNAADASAVYAIIGDLSGAQVNYPEGDGVVIKYDDLSEAEADLVKVVGRQYAAHGVTACNRFTLIAKPAAATT